MQSILIEFLQNMRQEHESETKAAFEAMGGGGEGDSKIDQSRIKEVLHAFEIQVCSVSAGLSRPCVFSAKQRHASPFQGWPCVPNTCTSRLDCGFQR